MPSASTKILKVARVSNVLPLRILSAPSASSPILTRSSFEAGTYLSACGRVLRRVMRLAVEWGVLESMPKVKLLPGEKHRERVVTHEEEARYLAAAPEPLGSIAAILTDTGIRQEECFRLCWEAITWLNGRDGTLLVTHGKTAAARRVLPMTPRVRNILEGRWEAAGKPAGGWEWRPPTRSDQVE